jgi:hypothetical protein
MLKNRGVRVSCPAPRYRVLVRIVLPTAARSGRVSPTMGDYLMENMENFVERHNVERFRKLLIVETDPTKRILLLRLLADEEAKQASHIK